MSALPSESQHSKTRRTLVVHSSAVFNVRKIILAHHRDLLGVAAFSLSFLTSLDIFQTGSKFSVGRLMRLDTTTNRRQAFRAFPFFRFVDRILAFRWFVQHILPKKHRDSSRSRSSWECCLLRQSIMSRAVQEPGISIATPITWFPLEHVNTNVRLTTPVQNAYVFDNCRARLYRAQ